MRLPHIMIIQTEQDIFSFYIITTYITMAVQTNDTFY